MTAAELNEVYRDQLRASLLPPWKPGPDPGGTRSPFRELDSRRPEDAVVLETRIPGLCAGSAWP